MVQLFYHEQRGKSYRKFLKHEGYPNKILLFPHEGWAHPTGSTYWLLKTPWWSRSRCKVIQVTGSQRFKTKAKLQDVGQGTMVVSGKMKTVDFKDPYFRLTLTTDVSNEDFQMGYSMTGTLERSPVKYDKYEMTHFAMIKRKGY